MTERSALLGSYPARLELTTLFLINDLSTFNWQPSTYQRAIPPKTALLWEDLLLLQRIPEGQHILSPFTTQRNTKGRSTYWVCCLVSAPSIPFPAFCLLGPTFCLPNPEDMPGHLDTYYSVLNITGTHSLALIPGSAPPHRLYAPGFLYLASTSTWLYLVIQSRATTAMPWRHSMSAINV